ncbi:MAG: hypothetical protein M0C28_39085 [Candidatus Moduliflexus flocculans]|nr:hypothetical protein [Candidatus Moduliflexus flocculans]
MGERPGLRRGRGPRPRRRQGRPGAGRGDGSGRPPPPGRLRPRPGLPGGRRGRARSCCFTGEGTKDILLERNDLRRARLPYAFGNGASAPGAEARLLRTPTGGPGRKGPGTRR